MKWSATFFAFPLSAASALILMTTSCGTAGLGADNGTGNSFDGSMTNGGHDGGKVGRDSGVDSTTTSLNHDGGGLGGGGLGQCVPATCTELGVNCGPMGDGCGNLIQCGNCTAPETCGGGGKPSNCGGNNNCKPATCASAGTNCGPVGDGCGNLLQCGSCTGSQTCGGGGMPSVCGGTSGCVSTTCALAGVNCGPIGDGCGNLLQCGNCSTPETCGGAGKPGVCGDGLTDAGDGGSKCVPKTCAGMGVNCGPAGDGCGNQLNCGTCTAPATCGGGGAASVCGGTGSCVPTTCAKLGVNCGPAGDGCGGDLNCGACTAPQTCGGGGVPSVCGGDNDCVPKTCAQLGFNCGPAGDGCGGLLQCGLTCPAGEICGGGGAPGVCGPADAGTSTCTGLCLKQTTCASPFVTTTITGTVYAPNGVDPIYDALVYVPNAPVAAFTPGAACEQCTNSVSGSPLVSTISAPDGTFQLQNVPVGTNIPIVIQLGRWRRQLVIPTVTACVNNTQTAPFFRLPKNKGEGDIPLIAMVTGSADPLECVLRKIGIDDAEFTDPTANGGTGRVQFYVSNGSNSPTGDAPALSVLTATQATVNKYDMVILACEGAEEIKPTAAQAAIIAYAGIGGRVFATHYSYTWLFNDAPFTGTATWDVNQTNPPDPLTGFIDFTNPKGQAFAQWSQVVGASTTYGQVTPLDMTRDDFTAVNAAEAQRWLYWKNGATQVPLHYTFNTPVGATAANQCGRTLFSDFHVNVGTGTGNYPAECSALGTPLTAQEHLLEFMLFDLSSCITPLVPPPPPTCTPETCMQQGFNCGPAGDGCGNELSCGTCTPPQTCGGGGQPGVCGGTPCTPITCATQGIQCGPAGDGCGDLIQCGNCPNSETCGGGGVPGKCGSVTCAPITCASQGIQCGPAGNGCGGLLECGNCPVGEACGGSGQSGKCGAPDASTCIPITCAAQSISCGPAGNGCGGQLDCGPCTPPQTCGGGGVPGMCGAPICTATTCSALGFSCGPAGDGCGGVLQCGTCPPNETCGGGGTPGVCGSSCKAETCASLGLNCGPAGDGCGGSLQCGTCVSPLTCGGGGKAGVCGQLISK